MSEWERPTVLGLSYVDVRSMDDDEIVKAGIASADRLAAELANRFDIARAALAKAEGQS